MMNSDLFEKYQDPKTGVEYHLLKQELAQNQQAFYFVNASATKDMRYIWFFCWNDISGDGGMKDWKDAVNNKDSSIKHTKDLAIADLKENTLRLVEHEWAHDVNSSVYIDEETGDAYYTKENCLFHLIPQYDATPELLFTIPKSIATYKKTVGLSTHITRSVDKKELFLAMRHDDLYTQGTYHLETKEFCIWHQSGDMYNHEQINPANKDIALMARDFHSTTDGEFQEIGYTPDGIYQRLWTLTRDGILTLHPAKENYATHEWWARNGKRFYYCNHDKNDNQIGVASHNIETGEDLQTFDYPAWHSFSSQKDEYFIFDTAELDFANNEPWFRGCASSVSFYNAKTKKRVRIAQYPIVKNLPISNYHVDPHPRFIANDQYVIWTAIVHNHTHVACMETQKLIDMTK